MQVSTGGHQHVYCMYVTYDDYEDYEDCSMSNLMHAYLCHYFQYPLITMPLQNMRSAGDLLHCCCV